MEGKNNYKVIALAALLIAVVGLSIGFAALTTTLTVRGNATIAASKWEVKFSDLTDAALVGSAKEITTPSISGTTLGTYDITLKEPGDSISYTFDIENSGDFDAKITGITIQKPNCVGAEQEKVCSKLSYTLKYTNTDNQKDVSVNDVIPAGTKKNVTLKLLFDASATAANLPASDVSINNLGFSITFNQQ